MECQGQVATYFRMCYFTLLLLGKSTLLLQVKDRPEIVNTKLSSAGTGSVPSEWPVKGSRHFLRDKTHLSPMSPTARQGPPPGQGPGLLVPVTEHYTWGSGKFSLFFKWGIQLLTYG